MISLSVSIQYKSVTDRQTDRQTDTGRQLVPRLRMWSGGNKPIMKLYYTSCPVQVGACSTLSDLGVGLYFQYFVRPLTQKMSSKRVNNISSCAGIINTRIHKGRTQGATGSCPPQWLHD